MEEGKVAAIKNWIIELRTVKKTKADSILVHPLPQQTKIILLDTACCVPAIVINKTIEKINKSDLLHHIDKLNHHH